MIDPIELTSIGWAPPAIYTEPIIVGDFVECWPLPDHRVAWWLRPSDDADMQRQIDSFRQSLERFGQLVIVADTQGAALMTLLEVSR